MAEKADPGIVVAEIAAMRAVSSLYRWVDEWENICLDPLNGMMVRQRVETGIPIIRLWLRTPR